jgi:UPF0148 protein
MVQKKPEDIMAEYLLRGGKMLAKTCSTCGSPLFEVRGVETCVICDAPKAVESSEGDAGGGSKPILAASQVVGSRTLERHDLSESIGATIMVILRRIEEEPDPEHCLTLMKAVWSGAEAIKSLGQR